MVVNIRLVIYLIFLFIPNVYIFSQKIEFSLSKDSLNPVEIKLEGFLDVYYGYFFGKKSDSDLNYFFSSQKHNEFNINLSYLSLGFKTKRLRLKFTPGFGTYMNSTYISEEGVLKNILEASVGVKPFKNFDLWIDAGVLNSPYTNETCISKDQLTYSRSLAPEYVPYYLSGIRVSFPIVRNKLKLSLYGINGWQQIKDQNQHKSFGSSLEWNISEKNTLNWQTYLGDERSAANPNFRLRFFSEWNWIYNPEGKFSMTACAYWGLQRKKEAGNSTSNLMWWQANLIAQYKFLKNNAITSRVEYFDDPNGVQIVNINDPALGFKTFSFTLGYQLKLFNHAYFRTEARQFYSLTQSFQDNNGNPTSWGTWIVSSISLWF